MIAHAPKPASSGPKPSQPVVSVPVRHEEDDEELTKTQRKNKKKAEQQKAMKEALAREQEERLRQHRVEQRAAGINMRYIPPPSAPPQSMWKKPAGAAPTSPTGPAKPPITDDFSEIWD